MCHLLCALECIYLDNHCVGPEEVVSRLLAEDPDLYAREVASREIDEGLVLRDEEEDIALRATCLDQPCDRLRLRLLPLQGLFQEDPSDPIHVHVFRAQ